MNIEETNTFEIALKKRQKRKNRRFTVIFGIIIILFISASAFFVTKLRSDKKSFRNQGITAYKNGDFKDAETFFKKSLAEKQWLTDNMDSDTKMYLASTYTREADFKSASDLYADLEKLNSEYLKKYNISEKKGLTDALLACKSGNDYKNYLDVLKREADRGNTSMYLYLGTCYAETGKEDEMLSNYQKYLSSNNSDASISYLDYQLSTYYLKKNDLENAKTYIDNGLSSSDQTYIDLIRYNDIVFAEKSNDLNTAYEKAVSLHKDYPDNDLYKREFDFLDTRININETPVHTKGDAEESE